MGTPVSKSDDTISSQGVSACKDSRRNSKTRSETPNEEVSTHMLCADDDDPADCDELVDMYTSLTTNDAEHNIVMNTKFDRNSLQSLPSIGAIVEKELYTPNGRVCSANGRVTARFISAEMLSADNKLKAVDTSTEETETVDNDCDEALENENVESTDYVNSSKSYLNRVIDKDEETSNDEYHMADKENDYETNELDYDVSQSLQFNDEEVLDIPAIERNDVFSPVPKSPDIANGCESSEGSITCVPRKRFNSIGVESVISGMEPLDDAHTIFFEEVKQCMTKHGFFDKFPSPAVVNEAQNLYKTLYLDLHVPTDEDTNSVPNPPKTSVHEIIRSPQCGKVFDAIEKMPMNLQKNGKPGEIANYLCKGVSDEANKLYAIVTFMVYQHWESLTTNDQGRVAETSLRLCKWIRTYCKFCKIKSTIIKGILRDSKCATNEEACWVQKFWIAVLVKESWILIDPLMTCIEESFNENGTVLKDVPKEYVSKCVESSFQEPTEFVFSHYPDEEIWQLLARPVLREELYDLALTRSGFFEYGMELLTHSTYNIYASNSEIVISLAYATSKVLQFKCSFRICDCSLTPADTRTFVFLETVILESKVHLRIRFPKKGSYFLELFGDSSGENWRGVVTYRITYEGDEIAQPFPSNPREEWGPGMVARSLGLEAVMYHSGEIVTRKGVLQIAFKDRNCLHFEFHVHPVDNISTDYLKVSFLKDRKHNVIFVVEIDAKVNGVFTLQLMARKPDCQENFQNFCNYSIKKEKSSILPIFKFDSRESLVAKEIIPANEDGTLQLSIDLSKFVHVTTVLQLLGKQEVDCSEHVRIWVDDKQAHIDLNFPRAGKYRFTVRGQKKTGGYGVVIKDETIQADLPSEQWSSFPLSMNYWDLFYKIEEPLTHVLKEKVLVTFCVYLLDAHDVAIVGPGGWNHLKKGDRKNFWVGQVWTGPKSTRCRLQARFEVGSDKWSELLWYKVISLEDYQRTDEKQKSMIAMIKNRKSIEDAD